MPFDDTHNDISEGNRSEAMPFDYAHNDTSEGERHSPTAQFVKLNVPPQVAELRRKAFERGIPTADDETLNFLLTTALAVRPERILELGTATGITAILLAQTCPQAHITTVEKNQAFYEEAKRNISAMGLPQIEAIQGDAGEVIKDLNGRFDFIFLDSAKVQYVKYLPRLKELMKAGSILLADDVLLYGYVSGEVPTPPKRKMLVQHIREYIESATTDPELMSCVLSVGDGICMSVKK
jgi:predicted O-methyltransferase YrrM